MKRYTDDLKQQVERVLRWEQHSHWRFSDFQTLSQLILVYTKQSVTAHELEAFWVASAIPSRSFLDALAGFVDYKSWDDFCDHTQYGTFKADDETLVLHAPMWEIPMRWVIAICWLSVAASVIIAALLVWKQ